MKAKTSPILDAVLGRDIAALQCALSAGKDIDLPDRQGRTPLANAVINEIEEAVRMLLAAGANVDARDQQGFTPLHHATRRHSLPMVDILLSAGAEVDSRDSYGNTPLSNAVFESRGRADVIGRLLAAGADQNLCNHSGVSPRGLAESIANFDVLSLLPNISSGDRR